MMAEKLIYKQASGGNVTSTPSNSARVALGMGSLMVSKWGGYGEYQKAN